LRNSVLVVVVGILCLLSYAQEPQTPSSNVPASTPPQVKQVVPSYEGQNVASLEIAGRPGIHLEDVQSLVVQREGEPFSQQKIDQTIADLKGTGKFKDVQLQVLPDVHGVRILLVLQPGMYFGIYDFPGALRAFSYTRLLQVVTYPPEGPYSDADITRASEALLKFFRQNGYFQAHVNPEAVSDPKHGIVNVIFYTQLGKRAKFGDVTLEGADAQQTKLLQSKLKSHMARLRGSAVRKGKTYKLGTLNSASQYLERTLQSKGFLGARVKLVGAAYDAGTNRADITFNVQSGAPIHVKVAGAHLWPWTRRKLIPVYQGLGVDKELIQEGKANLVSHFQSKGHFNTDVKVATQQQGKGESITYTITKGPRHKVKGVSIAGNATLSDAELSKYVGVKKARFLSHGKYSEQLVAKSADNIEAAYKAAGFSTASVAPQVRSEGGDIIVTFNVKEGPRDTVASLTINGATVPLSQLAPHGLKVVEGSPYSQVLVDSDRTQITARYLQLGFVNATFRATAAPVSKSDKHHVAVTYEIYEGPQVIISDVYTLGRQVTKQSFIDHVAPLGADEPMNQEKLYTAASELYTPGVFDWAEVDPRRHITTQDREDVVVKVHESKRNTLTYGFGFEVINRGGSLPGGTVAVPGLPPFALSSDFKTSEETFWGPRGTIQYTRRNLRGMGETFNVSALAGRLDQRASVSYLDPSFLGTSWGSSLAVSGEHNEENPIFSNALLDAGYQFSKPLNARKTENVIFRYYYRDSDVTHLLIPELVPPEDRHVRLSGLSAAYTRDTRDSFSDAHRGIYHSYEISINPQAIGSSVSFARFLGQTAHYKQLPNSIVWANSVRLGLEAAFAGSHVPVTEKFFSGGGSTLRGFPLSGAGPQHVISACGTTGCFPVTVPVGGDQLFIVNSEFRIPVPLKKGLGVVGFYDGGNVFADIGFKGQYTNTLGAGLRYATPVGPIRIDVGHNLNAPPGIKSTQVFITLGQAF
jgi:outer membrane protein insertion porin family